MQCCVDAFVAARPLENPQLIGIPSQEVRVHSVRVEPGERLDDVILRDGIEPNGDAYSLLYALNHGLTEQPRNSPTTLEVPVVQYPDRRSPVVLNVDGKEEEGAVLCRRRDDSSRLPEYSVPSVGTIRGWSEGRARPYGLEYRGHVSVVGQSDQVETSTH